jgi:hypothetical protein
MSLELSQSFGIGKENAPPLEEVETKAKDKVVRDRTPNNHYIALVCAYQLTEAWRRGRGSDHVQCICVTVGLVLFLTREPLNKFFGGKGDFFMYVILFLYIFWAG